VLLVVSTAAAASIAAASASSSSAVFGGCMAVQSGKHKAHVGPDNQNGGL
jgi:hypothetical protein